MDKEIVQKSAPQKPILIIRLSAMGDIMLCAPAVQSLCTLGHVPIFITLRQNLSLLLAFPGLNHALVYEDKKYFFYGRKKEAWENLALEELPPLFLNLKILNLLDFQNTSRSHRAIQNLKCYFKNKNIKIQKFTSPSYRWKRLLIFLQTRFILKQKMKPFSQKFFMPHVVGRHQECIEKYLKMRLPIPMENILNTQTFLPQKLSIPLDVPFVLFFPFGSYPLKNWPLDFFEALAKEILKNTDLNIVLCSGKEQKSPLDILVQKLGARVFNAAGLCTPLESLALIGKAHFVVTVDSFAAHGADLFSKRGVMLFGPTAPVLGFYPRSKNLKALHSGLNCSPCSRHGQGNCRFQNTQCFAQLTPQWVWEQCQTALKI